MIRRLLGAVRGVLRLPAVVNALTDRVQLVREHQDAVHNDLLRRHADAEGQLAVTRAQVADLAARAGRDQQEIVELFRHIEAMLIAQQRELRTVVRTGTLPAGSVSRWQPVNGGHVAPPLQAFPGGTLCRQSEFETPAYAYWMPLLHAEQLKHRKLWEFVFIAQALFERGMLQPGRKGVGFGVGQEPLAAAFAARGAEILGTDMDPDQAAEAGWVESAQHAAGREALFEPRLIDRATFDQRVSYRQVDMRAIPADLKGFDFCWSACAFEHLGSLDAGLQFFERSLDCLKPGGIAVHTTEFALDSDTDTVETGGTVLYRKQDLDRLAARLAAAGHTLLPVNLERGEQPLDRYIDLPPYRLDFSLKIAVEGYATTSVGLIAVKGG